jgi:hypothetical protein
MHGQTSLKFDEIKFVPMYTSYAVWSCTFGIWSSKGELFLKGTVAIAGIAKFMVFTKM